MNTVVLLLQFLKYLPELETVLLTVHSIFQDAINQKNQQLQVNSPTLSKPIQKAPLPLKVTPIQPKVEPKPVEVKPLDPTYDDDIKRMEELAKGE